MHVGIVTSSISRLAGGLYDITRVLARYLATLPETQVTVFGLADEYTESDLGGWGEIPVQAFKRFGPSQLGYAPAMAQALMDHDLDIIHHHGLFTLASRATHQWHKKTGKPYVISIHGMLDPWAVRNSPLKKKLARRLFEGANLHDAAAIVTNSDPETAAVAAYGLSNRVIEIPNAVNLPNIDEPIEIHQPTLLFLGRLHPKKGLELLIDAWKTLDGEGWQLRIVGEGTPEYERSLAARAAGNPEIILVGGKYGADKDKEYRSASAFILPSYSEGMPIAVLDAMAYALPTIITPHCNLEESIAQGAAFKIETQVKDVARGIRTMMNLAPEARQSMGEVGRALIKKKFTWERVVQATRELYTSVL